MGVGDPLQCTLKGRLREETPMKARSDRARTDKGCEKLQKGFTLPKIALIHMSESLHPSPSPPILSQQFLGWILSFLSPRNSFPSPPADSPPKKPVQ